MGVLWHVCCEFKEWFIIRGLVQCIGYPSERHFKPRSREISFVHNSCGLSWPTVLKVCTELCAKFENDWTFKKNVMDKQDLARFEFKMSFWRIFYIAQRPWPLAVAVSTRTLKAMQPKYLNCRSCQSIAFLSSTNFCNFHKLLPVQQRLQMLHLSIHTLYCQSGDWEPANFGETALDTIEICRAITGSRLRKLHTVETGYENIRYDTISASGTLS